MTVCNIRPLLVGDLLVFFVMSMIWIKLSSQRMPYLMKDDACKIRQLPNFVSAKISPVRTCHSMLLTSYDPSQPLRRKASNP